MGFRGGHGQDDRHDADHEVFRFLLEHHDTISRTVKQLPDGVETLTESSDPEVADKIKEHVQWMAVRVEQGSPIRMRDPLFAELFRHTKKIVMKHEDTEAGVRVTETSSDPYVARLIQAHAEVVSGFVERGFAEAMKNHAVPGKTEPQAAAAGNTVIKQYGAVFPISGATQQPRPGSRLVVDITQGGEPSALFNSIEKVARFVNLYGSTDDVRIAAVLHGDATLAVLNADAYGKAFGTQDNPNLDCLHELHEAGVELYVCGQSLRHKGAAVGDVVVFVDVATSAVTSLVNLQRDGYAYVPLK
jgi:intracellular sulfur oxidation DsrE/DsrF family protein